ncbi:MAG: hypothetical protein NT007_00110 [Candidatus Kapabacteria bacterium]|nr:hypothetical protein [Candidatus Kapabacteria bacterium]
MKTTFSCHSCACRNPQLRHGMDSRIRGKDRYLNISCFHTVFCAGMTILENILLLSQSHKMGRL